MKKGGSREKGKRGERDSICAELAELREQVKRLEEALTPGPQTKAAYIGEFQFDEESDDGLGTATRTVPWTTVKEIMAAIMDRAAKGV